MCFVCNKNVIEIIELSIENFNDVGLFDKYMYYMMFFNRYLL